MSKAQADKIVKRLKAASHAYYETGETLMTDDEYDDLLDELREIAPDHPYFSTVGAPVMEGAVQLPLPMPSLRKVKLDTIDGWTRTYKGPWLASDKLDGISALWVPSTKKLYLRGDGLVGQDVSHLVSKGIRGLEQADCIAVRGELIVPKASGLGRSWVNGQLHQKNPKKEDISRIEFVAYSVYLTTPLTRRKQVAWTKKNNFIVVPHAILETADAIPTYLQQRRQEGTYEIDGLVLGVADAVPEALDARAALPRDAVAFKMPLADQKAKTTVVAVHWASSMGGLWIPRIEIKPVTIGIAKITYATGHNARYIADNGIGPGAVIVIRRSGDVIPTVDSVVKAAPGGAAMPADGTWAWDANRTHAVDTRETVDAEKKALFIVDTLVVFGIEGVAGKNAVKLVEAGYEDLKALWDAREVDLVSTIGNALGAKLYEQLHSKIPKASPEQWILAYQGWPRGFGKTRVAALLEHCGSPASWKSCLGAPKGISAETFRVILGHLDGYLEWRGQFPLAQAPTRPKIPNSIKKGEAATPQKTEARGAVCFTGFRDKALEAALQSAGWTIHDSVKKSTTVLIVADESKMGSSKVAEARKAGIRIILREDVNQLLN